MGINYHELEQQEIDRIAPLWEKLNEYHRVRSKYFPSHFLVMNWLKRKTGLLEKTATGYLKLDAATDIDTNSIIGYCISSISGNGQGEIESLYVETEYRRAGIGDRLMTRALHWMDAMKVERRILGVGVGNEEVLSFYRRYGFFPRTIILEKIDEKRPGERI